MFSEVEQMFDYIQTINAASSLYIEIKYNNAKANANKARWKCYINQEIFQKIENPTHKDTKDA